MVQWASLHQDASQRGCTRRESSSTSPSCRNKLFQAHQGSYGQAAGAKVRRASSSISSGSNNWFKMAQWGPLHQDASQRVCTRGQAAAMASALGTSFGRLSRTPSTRLLKQKLGGPDAASAPAPTINLGWRSGPPCTKTPAKGGAQEGEAAAQAPAPGTSFGRRTRASNVRQLRRR